MVSHFYLFQIFLFSTNLVIYGIYVSYNFRAGWIDWVMAGGQGR